MKDPGKIAFLIGDGMADYPIPELDDKTPLEYSRTPHMDALAKKGVLGLVQTVPPGMQPGSDTANLSIFGYDPRVSYTGRAPLEALSMGLTLNPGDVAFRLNMVTIEDGIMKDFSAGHIDTEFSRVVIGELQSRIAKKGIELYPGVSYRNILIWRDYPHETLPGTTPPHDIQGKGSKDYLPRGAGADYLVEVMNLSVEVIAGSQAVSRGKSRFKGNPTSVWLWGCGRRPNMETLKEKLGLYGHTISAVDLIHGIGKAAGLSPIEVPGATGYIDTNYSGKAEAAIRGLRDSNFVFLHVESPDESGHEGNLQHKIRAIEDFDEKVVGPVLEGLTEFPRYAVLVMPDHPTPLSLRTHTSDPVPFCMYWSDGGPDASLAGRNGSAYSEADAKRTSLYIEHGHRLPEIVIRKKLL